MIIFHQHCYMIFLIREHTYILLAFNQQSNFLKEDIKPVKCTNKVEIAFSTYLVL